MKNLVRIVSVAYLCSPFLKNHLFSSFSIVNDSKIIVFEQK